MSMNNLLFWMSARGEGSWQQFKAAIEEIHLPAEAEDLDSDFIDSSEGRRDLPVYQRLRFTLEQLAHAEFFTRGCERGWRVAPPVLAAVQHEEHWFGILCGARSPRLVDRARRSAGRMLAGVAPQAIAPDQIHLSCDHLSGLASFAAEVGLFLQVNAPVAMLTILPAIDDPDMRSYSELPVGLGWSADRFSISTLGWKQVAAEEAKSARRSLFRFRMGHQCLYFFCTRGNTFRVRGQAGKYIALRHRRRVLRYERQSRCLIIPAACRPPLLIERALILCSGSLPSYNPSTGCLWYSSIPGEVAHLAVQLLRQEAA